MLNTLIANWENGAVKIIVVVQEQIPSETLTAFRALCDKTLDQSKSLIQVSWENAGTVDFTIPVKNWDGEMPYDYRKVTISSKDEYVEYQSLQELVEIFGQFIG